MTGQKWSDCHPVVIDQRLGNCNKVDPDLYFVYVA
jgi:hypothetical protein